MNLGRTFGLALWVSLSLTSLAVAEPPASEGRALTVRIYDYSDTEPSVLTQAQEQATKAFSEIGVSIVWRQAVRPRRIEAGRETWPDDGDAFITVNVQNREMAARRRIGKNVAGYAVIEPNSTGRVAFLIADRIGQIARAGRAAPSHVFGLVLTHELTHLLLGDHSHSSFGVMRPDWSVGEFRQSTGRFDARQSDAIRSAINRLKTNQTHVAD